MARRISSSVKPRSRIAALWFNNSSAVQVDHEDRKVRQGLSCSPCPTLATRAACPIDEIAARFSKTKLPRRCAPLNQTLASSSTRRQPALSFTGSFAQRVSRLTIAHTLIWNFFLFGLARPGPPVGSGNGVLSHGNSPWVRSATYQSAAAAFAILFSLVMCSSNCKVWIIRMTWAPRLSEYSQVPKHHCPDVNQFG